MSGEIWSALADWKRDELVSQKKAGKNVAEMALGLGMPYPTLDRRLREWQAYRAAAEQDERSRQDAPAADRCVPGGQSSRTFLRPAVFGIEVMDFSAGGNVNFMVCTCVLPLDSENPKSLCLEFTDDGDDRRVLQAVMAELDQYDILIGHNIAAFDLNWLHSRLAYHRMPVTGHRWLYYDTYHAAKRLAIKADRKSLAFLCDYFRIPAIKTSVMPVSWSRVASRSHEEFTAGMSDIVYHCEQDVLANRLLFDVLWPMDRSMQAMPVTKKW